VYPPVGGALGRTVSSAQMIDWEAGDLTRAGGLPAGAECKPCRRPGRGSRVAGLDGRSYSSPLRDVTGLVSQGSGRPGRGGDRPGWIRANVGGFRVVLDRSPIGSRERHRDAGLGRHGKGGRLKGDRVQAGLILAYLSARVLGQYELSCIGEAPPVPMAPATTAAQPAAAPPSGSTTANAAATAQPAETAANGSGVALTLVGQIRARGARAWRRSP